jgi:dTDP-4-amino-4,6-dideoxygalactose transaminase
MPSFTFIASAQSLSWNGIQPVFCDIDPITHQIATDQLDSLVDAHVTGIMGVNLWGGVCDPISLEKFSNEHSLKLYFDSAHAFGCIVNNTKVANFGSIEIFSFHATKILNATEGGCLCTNDDAIAAKLRNIRSSYGAGEPVPVVKTSNGRMSEAQAVIALMSLEDFPKNQQNNEFLFRKYEAELKGIPGIRLVHPAGVTFSNYQYIVFEVDEDTFGISRDSLIAVLKAENVNARRYFYPGTHRSIGYNDRYTMDAYRLPVTDHICASCIQLPIGAMVNEQDVKMICELINESHAKSHRLRSFFAGKHK